jgi:hypothetical protein
MISTICILFLPDHGLYHLHHFLNIILNNPIRIMHSRILHLVVLLPLAHSAFLERKARLPSVTPAWWGLMCNATSFPNNLASGLYFYIGCPFCPWAGQFVHQRQPFGVFCVALYLPKMMAIIHNGCHSLLLCPLHKLQSQLPC